MTSKLTCLTLLIALLGSCLFPESLASQVVPTKDIPTIIKSFKEDVRGPYLDIKWFCDDGTVREAKDPCPDEIGGVQHARYKDVTKRLHEDNKLYFSKILTGNKNEDFWSWQSGYDPIKQYQMNRYLERVDDGWIRRKAQFYRGAIQSEDEMEWGNDFFKWVLASDTRVKDNFLLIRQAAKDIPHRSETSTGMMVRAKSKYLSDQMKSFMDLRTKIHSNPEPVDIKAVEKFVERNVSKISPAMKGEFEVLIADMKELFRVKNAVDLAPYVKPLEKSTLKTQLEDFGKSGGGGYEPYVRIAEASELIAGIRELIITTQGGKQRLDLLDLSIFLENMMMTDMTQIEIQDVGQLIELLCFMNQALYGGGYIEKWEFDRNSYYTQQINQESISEAELADLVSHHARVIEWASANIASEYSETVDKYKVFETLSIGFLDDQIRSTILLPYGEYVSSLDAVKSSKIEGGNDVLGIRNQERVRGVNPGFAKGKLVILENLDDETEFEASSIYAFAHPPSDLSPVAGILAVNEGNMISHVQLLARNLGIPNAVLSEENINSLKKYEGEEIFYAVSLAGDVIMKKAIKMTAEEKRLFEKQKRAEEKVTVDVSKLDLKRDSLVNMRDLGAEDSGVSCGPKAANLAQLKRIFPDMVVEGMVVPFGVYYEHMQQQMETRSMTYWEFINQIFIDKAFMLEQGLPQEEVECIVLGELEILRNNIAKIPLSDELELSLKKQFQEILGAPLGEIPVFLRSDTNMEDLKDFTGAGLNLTKFNILTTANIFQGIKDVWASPFTERSYKWRQSYLNNPENVYPSILIIPSVNVDYSGVIITKDIKTNKPFGLTVSFSRGVGGAVDGQKAETYTIVPGEYPNLLAPAREKAYRTIPVTGGSLIETTVFNKPILTYQNIADLYDLVKVVRPEVQKVTGMLEPYDIELGFKDDRIWLFQIRPFVENKIALSNDYLLSISQFPDPNKRMDLSINL